MEHPNNKKDRTLNEQWQRTNRWIASAITACLNRLSPTARKYVLGITGLVIAMLCGAMIINALRHTDKFTHERITPIRIIPPAYTSPLASDEYELLQEFIHAMDSLRQHDPQTSAEILQGYKELIDTIRFFVPRHPR